MKRFFFIPILFSFLICLNPLYGFTSDQMVNITFPKNRHMNGYAIYDTPYGPGYHVDSIGSSQYGYNFLAYQDEIITADENGQIKGKGYFRQYDTFYGSLPVGRRFLRAYALSSDAYEIVSMIDVLNYTHGTNWQYAAFTISGLTPGEGYLVGFGRGDGWAYDWKLTAEWAQVMID